MDIRNHDVKTSALAFASHMTWMLGFPEQAVRFSEACESHARWCGRAFDLSFALTVGASVFNYLGQPDEVLERDDFRWTVA
jgi:hypothetical protein